MRKFPSIPNLVGFYYEWVLEFAKCFFFIYQDDHVVFVILLIWCITLISDVKPSLHSWDKSHVVMVSNPFYILLDSV